MLMISVSENNEYVIDKDDDDDNDGDDTYMKKRGDAGDIITANFLDFPPNLGIFRSFQVILGHFRQF